MAFSKTSRFLPVAILMALVGLTWFYLIGPDEREYWKTMAREKSSSLGDLAGGGAASATTAASLGAASSAAKTHGAHLTGGYKMGDAEGDDLAIATSTTPVEPVYGIQTASSEPETEVVAHAQSSTAVAATATSVVGQTDKEVSDSDMQSVPGEAEAIAAGTQDTSVLAVLAIVTSYKAFDKRDLIRTTYARFPADVRSKFVIRFVVGSVPEDEEDALAFATRLQFETEFYDDTGVLPIPENMDDGKTFNALKYIDETYLQGSEIPFMMKIDDDSILNLPALADFLDKLPRENVYFGRWTTVMTGFMHGGGYGMSRDVVDWVVHDGFVESYGIEGHEDSQVALWFKNGRPTTRLISFHGNQFHIPPETESNWWFHHDFNIDACLVHRVKADKLWLRVARYFLDGVHPDDESVDKDFGPDHVYEQSPIDIGNFEHIALDKLDPNQE